MSHVCGRGCSAFERLSRIAALRLRLRAPQIYNVVSWCRVCGDEVLLEVVNDYEMTVAQFHEVDDQPRVHNHHVELTNWGVHWRLDDVLFTLFPDKHHEELWPLTDWWALEYGEPKDRFRPLEILQPEEMQQRALSQGEVERRILVARIDREHKSKEQLLEEFHGVWSADELRREFEVYNHQPPFVIARKIATDQVGTLLYQSNPRYYFGWSPER